MTASGSGGTQAGLLAGRAVAGRGPRVVGVDVAKGGGELCDTVAELAAACLELLGSDAGVPPEDVVLVDGAGPGYGRVFAASRDAVLTALRTEGLLLDPVYTSKAVVCHSGHDRRRPHCRRGDRRPSAHRRPRGAPAPADEEALR